MAYFRSGISNIQKFKGTAVDVTDLPSPIASFRSNASGVKLDSLKVLVDAVQDLHGYDSPWVGGGGANLWGGDGMLQDFINANISDFSYDTTEKTLTYGAPQIANKTIKIFANAKENTAYTLILSAKNTANTTHTNLMVYYTDGTYAPMTAPTSLSTKQTFAYVTNASKTLESVRGGNFNGRATIYYDECCVLEGVKTVSDFVPWENICPITGWSGANVTRTGKNLFANTNPILGKYLNNSGNEISYTGWNISDFIPIKGGQTYHFNPNTTMGSSAKGFFYTSNVYSATIAGSMFNSGEVTITAPSEARYVRFSYRDTSTDIQLEIGSQATAYVAPLGNTYTIAFGDTYYGGELDVTNGVLRVTHKMVRITTVDTIHGDGKGAKFSISPLASGYTLDTNHFYCNMLKPSNYSTAYDNHIHFANVALVAMYFSEVIGTTKAEWETYLANNELQLCYELATPFTIQLTPQQIEQLEENNIWADTGDVSVCKYIQISQIGG